MEVTVVEVLKQMAYVIPSILLGTQTITAAIHGAFNISNKNVVHAISWIVAILGSIAFVAFNGLDFGVATAWNYVLGGVCGVIVGGAANGVYDWPAVARIFDAITKWFSKA